MRNPIAILTLVSFLMTGIICPMPVYAQTNEFILPAPGVMVRMSPPLDPPMLKGMKIHHDNPLRFDFILDKGDRELSSDQIKDESSKLIKYFLASLTIPEKDLWVNLSPYEKDRIIPNSFGLTEMGRDLLGEDYMLKQITASLIYPEDEIGKKFWKRIYEEAQKRYGTTNIPVNTFNKVWIVPEKAVVYENAKAGTAYVVESKLKVMLEQDYLSLEKHEGIQSEQSPTQGTNQFGSQIVREIVIPELTTEVNENKNFARLRQVYNSLILATWYKKKIKDSILEQVYADKNKVAGVNIDDPQEKEKIYHQYLRAFKKGVYNYIKEDIDPATQETIPRKYFSGGVDWSGRYEISKAMVTATSSEAGIAIDNDDHAMLNVEANIIDAQPHQEKESTEMKVEDREIISPTTAKRVLNNAVAKIVKHKAKVVAILRLLKVIPANNQIKFKNAIWVPVDVVNNYVPNSAKQMSIDRKRGFLKVKNGRFFAPVMRDPSIDYSLEEPSMHERSFYSTLSLEDLARGIKTRVVKGVGTRMPIGNSLFSYRPTENINTRRFWGGDLMGFAQNSFKNARQLNQYYEDQHKHFNPVIEKARMKYGITDSPFLEPLYILKPRLLPIKIDGKIVLMDPKKVFIREGFPEDVAEYMSKNQGVSVYEVPLAERLWEFSKAMFPILFAEYQTEDKEKILRQFSARLGLATYMAHQNGKIFSGYNETIMHPKDVTLTGHMVDLDGLHSLDEFPERSQGFQQSKDIESAFKLIKKFARTLGIPSSSGEEAFNDILTVGKQDGGADRAMNIKGLSSRLSTLIVVGAISSGVLATNSFSANVISKAPQQTSEAPTTKHVLNILGHTHEPPIFMGEIKDFFDLFSDGQSPDTSDIKSKVDDILNSKDGKSSLARSKSDIGKLKALIRKDPKAYMGIEASEEVIAEREKTVSDKQRISQILTEAGLKKKQIDDLFLLYLTPGLYEEFFDKDVKNLHVVGMDDDKLVEKQIDLMQDLGASLQVLSNYDPSLTRWYNSASQNADNLKQFFSDIKDQIEIRENSLKINTPGVVNKYFPTYFNDSFERADIDTNIADAKRQATELIQVIKDRDANFSKKSEEILKKGDLDEILGSEHADPLEKSLENNSNIIINEKILNEPSNQKAKKDKAALVKPAKYGGIDLTPANMNLQTQNAGEGIKFHLDAAMLQQLQNAPGFVPVIISIQPMNNIKVFLGLSG